MANHRRAFPCSVRHKFHSVQFAGLARSDRLLEEKFGPFYFGLALITSLGRLSLVVRQWRFLGLPLPLVLAPSGDSYEFVENGKFHFNVEICLPLAGLIVACRGYLEPCGPTSQQTAPLNLAKS